MVISILKDEEGGLTNARNALMSNCCGKSGDVEGPTVDFGRSVCQILFKAMEKIFGTWMSQACFGVH